MTIQWPTVEMGGVRGECGGVSGGVRVWRARGLRGWWGVLGRGRSTGLAQSQDL